MSTITNTNVSQPIEGWGGMEPNNEEMDQEFQVMREYDEIIQAIVPAYPPSLEDLQQQQQQEEQEQPVATVPPEEEGCPCACCRGTCACGRGHACDQEEEEDWRDSWYYEVQQGGLEWNESGYYD